MATIHLRGRLGDSKYMAKDKKESFIASIKRRDPAARNALQIFLFYPGFKAVIWYRVAHFFWKRHIRFIADWISYRTRRRTGIEIHPGATIGRHLFIDHGMGTVIGETAIIGDNCLMYHGVTLGGRGFEHGKRHPTVGNNVMIGTGAKILGNITIGDNSQIGANAMVLHDVEPNSVVIGVR